MSPQIHPSDNDERRPEYDFSQGVRGKHYQAYRAGTNVVFLEPDVAEVFPDSTSVNQALRLLVRLAKTKGVVDGRPNKARCSRRAALGVRLSRENHHARLAAERRSLDGGKPSNEIRCRLCSNRQYGNDSRSREASCSRWADECLVRQASTLTNISVRQGARFGMEPDDPWAAAESG